MSGHIYKRLSALLILLSLIVVGVGLTGQAIADVTGQASQVKTLDRNLEPVIVKGSQVAALIHTPVGQLFVYTYTGTAWGGQIPVQVDKVTASGSYTTTEDGVLDANDEIIFMAMDLGDQASDTAWLTTLPISATWYEIEVTDLASPGTTPKGWAYLVRSSALTPTFSDDYVDAITTSQRITITTNQYELGIPTAYPWIDYLALNGSGVDILDRTKMRVVFALGPFSLPLNESDLADNSETFLVKPGQVRTIFQQVVSTTPGGVISDTRMSATTTYLAYASLLQATASSSYTLRNGTKITSVRTSVDFTSPISGATFYNANSTDLVTVTIDGITDTVAITTSTWTQVSTTTGRLIQVSDPSLAGGTHQKTYYCDNKDSAPSPTAYECDGSRKTGDDVSYGDSGILIEGGVNPTFTITSSLFIPPPPDGELDNVGDVYADYYFNPLRIAAYLRGNRTAIHLPIILKSSQ